MKTTIEMAREAAGDDWWLFQEYMPEIHRLVELVRADERARMADQPAQQKPVAYGMWDTMLGKGNRMMMVRLDKGQDGCTVPLYTPAQRTWVGLTDEDVRQCSRDVVAGGKENSVDRFAYAIEAKLKEKNT